MYLKAKVVSQATIYDRVLIDYFNSVYKEVNSVYKEVYDKKGGRCCNTANMYSHLDILVMFSEIYPFIAHC